MKGRYSEETRVEVLRVCIANPGVSFSKVSTLFGVPHQTIRSWVLLFRGADRAIYDHAGGESWFAWERRNDRAIQKIRQTPKGYRLDDLISVEVPRWSAHRFTMGGKGDLYVSGNVTMDEVNQMQAAITAHLADRDSEDPASSVCLC